MSCKSCTKAKKGCAQTEEETENRKKQGRDDDDTVVRAKRRKAESGPGMSEEQFRELLGRLDEMEKAGIRRVERLEKRMDRHVGELVARHKMEQTRLDGIEQGLGRIERALEALGAKVDETEGDEGEETMRDADGEVETGKGKAASREGAGDDKSEESESDEE